MDTLSFKSLWHQWNFGDKIYFCFGIIVLIAVIGFAIKRISTCPRKKLDFIAKATSNGCMVVAKLTCLSTHGSNKLEYYEAEYMYIVNDKKYFITYRMTAEPISDGRKDKMNPDSLLGYFKSFLILFYDQKNPKKVFAKFEVFTSSDAMSKTWAPKNNAYRDIDSNWDVPVNLIWRY